MDKDMNARRALSRFIEAQEGIYEQALAEIKGGTKRSHWMWFIFPQLEGLGKSTTSRHYGIQDMREAEDYLADAVLGDRLLEITGALLDLPGDDASVIFGDTDARKLKSCMTLFAFATKDNPVFQAVLGKYFGGKRDRLTEKILCENMDCVNSHDTTCDPNISAKAACELYHRIWDDFNARWWLEYFDLNNRVDWGAPFIPSDEQIEGMLHTALLYTGAVRQGSGSKIVSSRVFIEAVILVRHGCPYSPQMVSLLLRLATDSFFLEFQDPFETTPCWFYLEPKFFVTAMGMVKDEFLRDEDFVQTMVPFLKTLKERFSAEWVRRQKEQWGPPNAFPEERYDAELRELLGRAEALLQKSGQDVLRSTKRAVPFVLEWHE